MGTLKLEDIGSLALCAGISTAGFIFGKGIGDLIGNVFSGLTSDKLETTKFKLLMTKDPGKLNHDLEKTVLKALEWTTRNIEFLYVQEYGLEKNEVLSKALKDFTANINKHISINEISNEKIISQVDGIENTDKLIENFNLDFSNFPAIIEDHPFPEYYNKKFASNFQLCFGELLKQPEHQKALIVYYRTVSKLIRINQQKNEENLNQRFDELLQKWEGLLNNNIIIPALDKAVDN